MRQRKGKKTEKDKPDTFANAVDAHFQFRSCHCDESDSDDYSDTTPSAPPLLELEELEEMGEMQRTPAAPNNKETRPSAPLLEDLEQDDNRRPSTAGKSSRFTAQLENPELKQLMQKVAANRVPSDDRYLLFEQLGTGPVTVIPRLLLLWIIGLPLLFARIVAGAALLFLTMGLPTMVVVASTTAGTVGFQMYYRDVLTWARESDSLQSLWDAFATVLTLMISVFVYTIRLFTEIHNGFCPIFALFFDILYELLRQLTVVWYAAPVLQYMAFWLLRLFVCLIEPMLDLLVAVAEAFMFMVTELLALIPPEVQQTAEAAGKSTADVVAEQRAAAMGFSLPEFNTYCMQASDTGCSTRLSVRVCCTAPRGRNVPHHGRLFGWDIPSPFWGYSLRR